MNFFTVGTLRDGEKWPNRDRRKNTDKLDLLIFDVLSPYTAQAEPFPNVYKTIVS